MEPDDRVSSVAFSLSHLLLFPSILSIDDHVSSGRGMDSIVQDLVFGHRGRARASTISSKEVTGSWLKDRRLLGFLKNEKGSRSGSGRSNGVDGRDISGGGGNRSESSTPTTRYDSNSSAHSVHMRSVRLWLYLILPL